MPNNSSSWVCSFCTVIKAKSQQGNSSNTPQQSPAKSCATNQQHMATQPTIYKSYAATSQPHAHPSLRSISHVQQPSLGSISRMQPPSHATTCQPYAMTQSTIGQPHSVSHQTSGQPNANTQQTASQQHATFQATARQSYVIT